MNNQEILAPLGTQDTERTQTKLIKPNTTPKSKTPKTEKISNTDHTKNLGVNPGGAREG
jgi:hypothetical protein